LPVQIKQVQGNYIYINAAINEVNIKLHIDLLKTWTALRETIIIVEQDIYSFHYVRLQTSIRTEMGN